RGGPSPAAGDDELGQMATVTAEGSIVGTPTYWAPEQLRGDEIDARADQFAWAVTAYELLCGAPPWTAPDPLALLSRILTVEPPPLAPRVPGLPEDVERALLRSLAKQPGDRFATIDEAADALEPFATPAIPQARASRPQAPGAPDVQATTNPDSAEREAALGRGADAAREPPRRSGGAPPHERDTGFSRHAGASGAPKRRLSGLRLAAGAAALAIGAAVIAAGTGVLRRGAGPAAAAPPGEAQAPLGVSALDCEEAALRGPGATPELARAIGVGACARLAVEIGAAWNPPGHAGAQGSGARGLRVVVELGEGRATASLAAGDRRGAASGATPMEAMVAAIAVISRQLAPPPMTAADVAAWGARDAAGARRIERVWRRMLLDFAPDDQVAARELLATDPDSAWSHVIARYANLGDVEGQKASLRRVRELSGRLPKARALLLGAMCDDGIGDPKAASNEMLRRARQAYAEAPDDPYLVEIAANMLVQGDAPEGLAVLDRLYERFPAHSVWPMMNTLRGLSSGHDGGRDRRYAERLRAIFPESVAWIELVRLQVADGDLDGARRSADVVASLGLGTSSGSFYAQGGRVWFHLAMLEPAITREIVTPLLGAPRNAFAMYASRHVLASYSMEGRIDEASSMRLREIERYRGTGDDKAALTLAQGEVCDRLLLGRPMPGAEWLSWMESTAAAQEPVRRASLRLAVATARAAADPRARAAAERALKELEGLADTLSEGDRFERDGILAKTIPAVRQLRGDAEAARRWRAVVRAPFKERRAVAYQAGLALEATGDAAGAEAAYQLAMDPDAIEAQALVAIAARVRLADLHRARGRDQEAARLDAEVDRVWAGADPGLREAIRAAR
ncbi:MAG: hypothetical protein IT372_38940, partial [Polyangiaceae bacterium]|nr:hypothetical protein [Polyangiaceae bacterium]